MDLGDRTSTRGARSRRSIACLVTALKQYFRSSYVESADAGLSRNIRKNYFLECIVGVQSLIRCEFAHILFNAFAYRTFEVEMINVVLLNNTMIKCILHNFDFYLLCTINKMLKELFLLEFLGVFCEVMIVGDRMPRLVFENTVQLCHSFHIGVFKVR